ncbi:MAG: hypothetical protein H7039_12395 [Bryobacteraceae bacterium]|nr:hypothetical protein [Bryobacteraceae bacterium]
MKLRGLVLVLTSLLVVPAAAVAGLIGDTVSIASRLGGDLRTDLVVAVSPGAEIQCPFSFNICGALTSGTQTIDVEDFSIQYRYLGPGANFFRVVPNLLEFTSLDLPGGINSVFLTTSISGLTASRISFGPGSVFVDMNSLAVSDQDFFRLDLTSAVPEPVPAAFVGLGLSALMLATRRVRRSTSA